MNNKGSYNKIDKKFRCHIKKGDIVKVISGKDKGKTGKVLRVFSDSRRVIVERVNFIKRHTRPSQKQQGGILEKEAAVNISNVMFYCPRCQEASRLGKKLLDNGDKVRVCKKCGEMIDTK